MDKKHWSKIKKEIEKLEPTSRINELKKLLEQFSGLKDEKSKEVVKEIKSDMDTALKELQEQRAMRISGSEEVSKTRTLVTTTDAAEDTEKSLDNIVETEIREEMKEQGKAVTYGISGSMGSGQGPYTRVSALYANPNTSAAGKETKYLTSTDLSIQDTRFLEGRHRGGPDDTRWQAHLRGSSAIRDERWEAQQEESKGFSRFREREEEEKVIKSEDILYKHEKYRRGETK